MTIAEFEQFVAFTNAKGGIVYMDVEDDGTVTGWMRRKLWNLFMTDSTQYMYGYRNRQI